MIMSTLRTHRSSISPHEIRTLDDPKIPNIIRLRELPGIILRGDMYDPAE